MRGFGAAAAKVTSPRLQLIDVIQRWIAFRGHISTYCQMVPRLARLLQLRRCRVSWLLA